MPLVAIDKMSILWYNTDVVDFCAPSERTTVSFKLAMHTLLFLYAVSMLALCLFAMG